MKRRILFRAFAAIMVGLFITSTPLFSQVRIKAADLLRAPQNYLWQQITLEGEVISTEHSSGMFKGTYKMDCNYGGHVEVESENLPAIGYRFEVTVTVKPGKDVNSFRLEEVKRVRPGSRWGNLILTSMVVVLGVVLVVGSKNTFGE